MERVAAFVFKQMILLPLGALNITLVTFRAPPAGVDRILVRAR